MHGRKQIALGGLFTAGLLVVFAFTYLTSRNNPPNREETVQPNAALLIPAAIETYSPPTTTPDLRPTPTYAPPPTLEPPPLAQTFPINKSSPNPNVAWSVESDNSLTIWVGQYSDKPSPMMTGARAVARWNMPQQGDYVDTRLGLVGLAVSPNGQYLAILLQVICVPPPPESTATPGGEPPLIGVPHTDGICMGEWPGYSYVVDLDTGKVQSVPDYYNHYALYAEYSESYHKERLLGWFDNDKFGMAERNGQMITATKDGASFIERIWPGQGIYDNVFASVLLPDHKTIFAWVNGGFYFRDAPTGAIRKVGNPAEGVGYTYLTPSPDGKLISDLEPEAVIMGNDGQHYSLWVQELATDARHKLTEIGAWYTPAAWSPDSTQLAYAYGGTGRHVQGSEYNEEEGSNLFLTNITNLTSRKLTNFTGAHNRDIQWTPGGNLLLSSTADSHGGGFGLIEVSPVDGKVTTLVAATQGEQLLHATFFGEYTLPGMPRSGVEPDQPTPTQPDR